jgi:flagellar basal-body rod modification protein FlgD
MDVTSTKSVTYTTSSDTISNPDAELDKDAFLQLFLTELQYQDPTSPMETQQMMDQTAQLSAMETNQNLQTALDTLTSQLAASSQFSTVSAIGKMADTGQNALAITDAASVGNIPFDLYFAKDFSSSTINIKDMNGNIVRSFDMGAKSGGVLSFNWDGKDDNGSPVADGTYTIEADYKSQDGQDLNTELGKYPVSAVQFDNGNAKLKLGSKYYSLNEIKEIY